MPKCENPYPKDRRLYRIEGLVDPYDFKFVRDKFFLHGLHDKIVSNLYKKFVDEARRLDDIEHFDGGLFEASPVLADIFSRLTFVERRPAGSDTGGGDVGAQHDAGSVGGVCETVRGAEVVSPEPQGRVARRRNKKSPKDTEEK